MVDSINSGIQPSQVTRAEGTQRQTERRAAPETSSVSASVDQVSVSQEATELASAQQATQNISNDLAQNSDITLSGDLDRLNALL